MDILYVTSLIFASILGGALLFITLLYLNHTKKNIAKPNRLLPSNKVFVLTQILVFSALLLAFNAAIKDVFGDSWYSNYRVILLFVSLYTVPAALIQMTATRVIAHRQPQTS